MHEQSTEIIYTETSLSNALQKKNIDYIVAAAKSLDGNPSPLENYLNNDATFSRRIKYLLDLPSDAVHAALFTPVAKCEGRLYTYLTKACHDELLLLVRLNNIFNSKLSSKLISSNLAIFAAVHPEHHETLTKIQPAQQHQAIYSCLLQVYSLQAKPQTTEVTNSSLPLNPNEGANHKHRLEPSSGREKPSSHHPSKKPKQISKVQVSITGNIFSESPPNLTIHEHQYTHKTPSAPSSPFWSSPVSSPSKLSPELTSLASSLFDNASLLEEFQNTLQGQ